MFHVNNCNSNRDVRATARATGQSLLRDDSIVRQPFDGSPQWPIVDVAGQFVKRGVFKVEGRSKHGVSHGFAYTCHNLSHSAGF